MSLAGKTAVILGATGNIGSGAAHALLAAGALVVLVGREESKLRALKAKLDNLRNAFLAIGNFSSQAEAQKTRDHVLRVLGGRSIDHVISSLGFITPAPGRSVIRANLRPGATTSRAGTPGRFHRTGRTVR